MTQYRKPDQYYMDWYDRMTIQILKEEERKYKDSSAYEKAVYMKPIVRDKGIQRARSRETTIREWIEKDEWRDKYVRGMPLPKNVICDSCKLLMEFEGHLFEENSVLFLFKCQSGHLPKKIVHENGKKHIIRTPTCSECGYEIKSKLVARTKTSLTTVYTCSGCGKAETDKISLKKRIEKPINEKDRLNYCSFDPKQRTFIEALEDIYKLKPLLEKSLEEKKYVTDEIEKLTIPQLEQRLMTAIEPEGYFKLEFEKPKFGSFISIEFSLQDPTSRSEKESVKLVTRKITDSLSKSNWRLMTKGIFYRLGFLNGQLRAYETQEDLIKIAKEIAYKQDN